MCSFLNSFIWPKWLSFCLAISLGLPSTERRWQGEEVNAIIAFLLNRFLWGSKSGQFEATGFCEGVWNTNALMLLFCKPARVESMTKGGRHDYLSMLSSVSSRILDFCQLPASLESPESAPMWTPRGFFMYSKPNETSQHIKILYGTLKYVKKYKCTHTHGQHSLGRKAVSRISRQIYFTTERVREQRAI